MPIFDYEDTEALGKIIAVDTRSSSCVSMSLSD